MTENSKLIWLVEDDRAFADSLIYILDSFSDLNVAKHFPSSEELLDYISSPSYTMAPDLILLDIRLPGISGIELVPKLAVQMPEIPVVMMTMNDDQQSVIGAMKSGAVGYIIKGDPYDKVLDVIRASVKGMMLISDPVKAHVLDHLHQEGEEVDFGLTGRQSEVLQLMCEGLSKADIAGRLSITHATADNHFRHIYQKLGVNSAHAAVALAFRKGLV